MEVQGFRVPRRLSFRFPASGGRSLGQPLGRVVLSLLALNPKP